MSSGSADARRASGALLEELRPLIPRALLDGPGWDRVTACAAELPDAGSVVFLGCEFRLGEDAPAADLFMVARPGSPLARRLVRRGKAARPGSAAAALARYLVRVGQPDSELHGCIAGTMLEYDLAETPPDRRPEPGVFLKVRLAEGSEPPDRPQPLPLAALADAVGWADGAGMRRSAARVLAALPPGARVAHVGAFPSRTPRAVRLVVRDVGRDELGGLLERLGRRGSISPATEILAGFRDCCPRFLLAVDVAAAGPLPRIGLELYQPKPRNGADFDNWLATRRSDWRPVVERLAQRGWCLAVKAQGLLEWCAFDRMYDRRGVFLVYKGINHVKLTVTDAGVGAKAYAGVTCFPMRDPPRPEH